MDARPALERIARALASCRLEAILIGNAAAALHGAPVTTLDFDFLFRKTDTNVRKLKTLARELHGTVFRPFYPVSNLFRVQTEIGGLQLDFMPGVHGIRSFESARSRATSVDFASGRILVASLADVIKSKRAAGRPQDRAVLPILEETLREIEEAKGKSP
ncbi:MAG TPA: hypothetical protein VHB21_06865 [Minicystis sp.]|nr:hypothetical protein [Minicystis sp.]